MYEHYLCFYMGFFYVISIFKHVTSISPAKLAKSSELIPQKLNFGFFFSLYLTNKHTKSPDTYPFCIDEL